MNLTVTVDLAPEGELSTGEDWAVFLQEHLANLAGHFRPRVAVSRLHGLTQSDENR